MDDKFTGEIKELRKKLENKKFLTKEKEIVPELGKLLFEAVKTSTENYEKIGVAFSGGVDSTLLALICERLKKNFVLYGVGLQNSKDLGWAEKIASERGWKIKIKELSLEEAEETIKKVAKILKTDDVVSVGVACVSYEIFKNWKNKADLFINGLGSEEIFAGYERHMRNTHEECWNGLETLWNRDLKRDLRIASHFKTKIASPFLDKPLIRYAMQIDPKLKIKGKIKKFILRKVALSLGLKKKYAFRKKLAAQYGSRFDWAIEKIARIKKFKYKKEYLKSIK